MARIIPSKPFGLVPGEVARVFAALKRLPREDVTAWLALSTTGKSEPPHFLVSDDTGCMALVAVSRLSAADAQDQSGTSLFRTEAQGSLAPGAYELEAIQRLIVASGLAETASARIRKLILFANLSEADLADLGLTVPDATWRAGSRTDLAPDALLRLLFGNVTASAAAVLHAMRTRFSPESVIPAQAVVRAPVTRNLGATVTDYLLDLDQEACAKRELHLSSDAAASADDDRVRLVTGVAGSGKSLVLLARAAMIPQLFREQRILVLTHNKPLIRDLERKAQLFAAGNEIEWRTFNQWIFTHFKRQWGQLVHTEERQRWAAELKAKYVSEAPFAPGFLLDEFDWIKDHGITSRAKYLEIARTGRTTPLDRPSRHRVFDAFVEYQNRLRKARLCDWSSIPLRVLLAARKHAVRVPQYDFILVDEAQFFAPVWFELLRFAIRPGSGSLFLAADPTQGFLRRGKSWVSCGIEVRGRTTRLTRAYRNTAGILRFAADFYRRRLPADPEEGINVPDERELALVPPGPRPMGLHVATPQDTVTRIGNEIAAALERGIAPENILVIHGESSAVPVLLAQLQRRLPGHAIRDARLKGAHRAIRVAALNAATGLESPIVFLAGLEALLESERDPRLMVTEREELIRDNTRRIYMAITRAAQHLVILYRSTSCEQALFGGKGA